VGAAEVYGLSILRNDLQDSSDNRTRFVLLGV
jgi:prephenate dehydratase